MEDYGNAYRGMLGRLFGNYIAPNPYMIRKGLEPIGERGWNREALSQAFLNRMRNNPLMQEYFKRDAMRYGIDYPSENSFNLY